MQINNPDKRVEILKKYVQESFPDCPLLKYALQVEKITTSKVIILSNMHSLANLRFLSKYYVHLNYSLIQFCCEHGCQRKKN